VTLRARWVTLRTPTGLVRYYKDSTGHARGPAVVDTLRIMWDFR
jgi:hypothetical protein